MEVLNHFLNYILFFPKWIPQKPYQKFKNQKKLRKYFHILDKEFYQPSFVSLDYKDHLYFEKSYLIHFNHFHLNNYFMQKVLHLIHQITFYPFY